MNNNPWFSKIAVWLVIGLVLFTVFKQLDGRSIAGSNAMQYSDFLDAVRSQRVSQVVIQESTGGTSDVLATLTDGSKVRTTTTQLTAD